MSEARPNRRRIIYATAGNVSYALGQLGVLVVLTRSVSPADVGLYALALAITAPIHIALGLRLRTARAVHAAPHASLATYLRLAVVTSIAAVVVSSSVGAIVVDGTRAWLVVTIIALSKAIESLIEVSYGELQRVGRLGQIALSQGTRAILTLTAAYFGMRLGGLVGTALGLVAVWFLQYIVLELPAIRKSAAAEKGVGLTEHSNRPAFDLARHTLPLGVAAGITSLTASAPRYIVAATLGEAALGVFSVLAYTTVAMTLVANSVGQAIIGDLANLLRKRQFTDIAKAASVAGAVILGAGAIGLLGLVTAGEPLLSVFGPVYAEHVDIAIMLMLAAVVSGLATVAYYLLTSAGSYGQHPGLVLAVSAVGLPVLVYLTGEGGLSGAALGVLLMYAVQLIFTVALVMRHYQSLR